jgi:hypothetical protein
MSRAVLMGLVVLTVLPAWGAEPKRPTADPAMSRGAPAAPVTIFEFSDYQ